MVKHQVNHSEPQPVLIMAGGTGGHVFPALAVARELRSKGVPVIWLGTQAGIEARLVPAAGITLECLDIVALRGKGMKAMLLMPLRLLRAVKQAMQVLRRCQPRSALGMGGFAAGPGGIAVWLQRIPLVIHEQNAIPGLTNRVLSFVAQTVLQAMPGAFRKIKQHTGNPVRDDLSALPEPKLRSLGERGKLRLLVVGGSQGAAAINELVPKALAELAESQRPEVWHQAGERHLVNAQAIYQQHDIDVRLEAFIDDMAAAYAWADLVICRSGAMTVSELCSVGLAAILIPFPYAVDDHQTHNGRFLETAGAALMAQEAEITPSLLAKHLSHFNQHRAALLTMAEAARGLAMPQAASIVAQACLEAKR